MIKLSTARTIGQENIASARGLIKDLQAGKPVVKAKFSTTQGQINSLIEAFMPSATAQASQNVAMLNLVNPRFTADSLKSEAEVVIKKLGKGKIISAKTTLSDAEGVLQKGEFKILNNPSGTRFIAKGNGESMNLQSDTIFLRRHASESSFETMKNIIDRTSYEEVGEMGKMTIDAKDAGPIKQMSFEMSAPAKYIDAVMNHSSKGRYSSFGEMIKDVKGVLIRK